MKVYFIRHGQSYSNLLKMHDGQGSAPLTPQGCRDAVRAGARLASIQFDRVYSSDQKRAMQTAGHAIPETEIITDARIREIDVGSIVGRTVEECTESMGEVYLDCRRRADYTRFGGENDEALYNRGSEFIKMLEGLTGCENIAVFSHAGAIRCMVSYILGLGRPLKNVEIPNCAVIAAEYESGSWKLILGNDFR